jgi:TMEM175 potassium channel family protein
MERAQRASKVKPLSENTRLLSLSDCVFAFAMTLLVLGLQIPHPSDVSSAHLPAYVQHQFPSFFAWVLSFLVIGLFWLGHHRLFNTLRFHDDRLAFLNLLALLAIAFMPYPTALVGEYSASRFAAILYACSLLAASGFLTLIQLHVMRNQHMLHDDATPKMLRLGLYRSASIQVIAVISIAVALFDPGYALWCWFLAPPAHHLITRMAG